MVADFPFIEAPQRLRAFVRAHEASLILLAAVTGTIGGLVVAAMGAAVLKVHEVLFAIPAGEHLSSQDRIDPLRAGRPLSAYVNLKVTQQSWKTLRQRLLAIDDVDHAASVSGEYDIVLLVRTRDVESLRDLVLTRLQEMPEVLATQTVLIFDEMLV